MKRVRHTPFIVALSTLCLILSLSALALAKEEYPTGPITFLVGWSAGGSVDVTARTLAEVVKKELGQPVVVVNKPGMASSIMLTHLAHQKPDGYTIGLVAASNVIVNPLLEKIEYTPDDFTYIRGCGYMVHCLGVNPKSPWKTFKEFVEYAKKNPKKVKYGSYSPISTTSFLMRLIAKAEGIDWEHIPFKGDAAATMATIGGHTDAATTANTIFPYVRSGQIRLLVVFNENRSPEFPDVPTTRELGYDLPALSDMGTFFMILAPKGLKGAPLEKLSSAFSKAVQDPSYAKIMKELGQPILNTDFKETNRRMTDYRQKLEKIYPDLLKEVQEKQ